MGEIDKSKLADAGTDVYGYCGAECNRNRLRLQEFFRRLQAHPEIRLLQHAFDAGFGSYAQFYRVFTQALGVPPRQWLRKIPPPPVDAKSRPDPSRGRTARPFRTETVST